MLFLIRVKPGAGATRYYMTMTLYEMLAPIYDELFPIDQKALPFLSSLAGGARSPRLLDAGCATGAHALALAALGWKAVGIDSESMMIDLAKEGAKRGGVEGSAAFIEGTILEIEALLAGAAGATAAPAERFDLILCLGNTLPHLAEAGTRAFLSQARRLLRPGAAIVLQTLNYSHPRVGPGFVFPDIAAGDSTMRRSYRAPPPDRPDALLFAVELESGGRSSRGETLLVPLSPSRIESLLLEAGFAAPDRYAGWDSRSFDEARDLYCVSAARAQ